MKIKVNNTQKNTLTLYYKADDRKPETKGYDAIKLLPCANLVEVSEAEYKQIVVKLDFYKNANQLDYNVVEEKEAEKPADAPKAPNTPAEALTDETYMDSSDKEALKVFGASLKLEINKQKGLDKIKSFIAEALATSE